jgi:hypothetical protein
LSSIYNRRNSLEAKYGVKGRELDGREEELRPVLHGCQGARRGWGAVDAALGTRAFDGPQALQGPFGGVAWDRDEPSREQAQDARGGGDRPAGHLAAGGIERLRADGFREGARAGDRGPLEVGGEVPGRASRRGRAESWLGRGGDAVCAGGAGRGWELWYLRVTHRRGGVPPADPGRRERGGGQAGLGPGSRPGRRRRLGDLPCGGLGKIQPRGGGGIGDASGRRRDGGGSGSPARTVPGGARSGCG